MVCVKVAQIFIFFYIGGSNGNEQMTNGDSHQSSSSGIDQQSKVPAKNVQQWAASIEYDAKQLFDKVCTFKFVSKYILQLFHDDIEYLLRMDKLWVKRNRPTP